MIFHDPSSATLRRGAGPRRRWVGRTFATLAATAGLGVGGACATQPKPAPEVPAPATSSSTSLIDAVAPTTTSPAAADPRLVRCGVDDSPRNVLGAAQGTGPSNGTLAAFDGFLSHPWPTGAALGGRAVAPRLDGVVSFKMMPAPQRRPAPSTAPPLAAPSLHAILSAAFAPLPEGSRAALAPEREVFEGKRFDVSPCADAQGRLAGTVELRLRLASSGAPIDVFVGDSRGSSPGGAAISEAVTRCVAELGCHLSFPTSPPTEPPHTTTATTSLPIALLATLEETPPVFSGSVSVRVTGTGPGRPLPEAAEQKLEAALTPAIKECLQAGPPASTMRVPMTVRVDDRTHVSLVPRSYFGAAQAFVACLGPRLDRFAPLFAAAVKPGAELAVTTLANVPTR
jgi:hypothetical protein